MNLEQYYIIPLENYSPYVGIDPDIKYQVKIDYNRLKDSRGLYKGFYISKMPENSKSCNDDDDLDWENKNI